MNVLATNRKMGFRNYDVYDVIVTPQTGNGG